MVSERTLVRVQEEGQVTLPTEVRERFGLKEGDLVAVVETPDGVLLSPQALALTRALDDLGAVLRESGVTLEEWIESGREIRGELVREWYGLDPDDDPT